MSSTSRPNMVAARNPTTSQRAAVSPAEAERILNQAGGLPTWAKVLLSAVVLGGALVLLLYVTAREDVEWYKHVDEVMAAPARWQGEKLQLHGHVVPGSVMRRPSPPTHEYRFRVEHNGASVEARYTGIVPDTFKEGSDVVLKGRMTKEGFFQVAPGGVVAKCPSKYKARAAGQKQ